MHWCARYGLLLSSLAIPPVKRHIIMKNKITDYSSVKCKYMTRGGSPVVWTTDSLEDGMLTYRKAIKKRAVNDRPVKDSFSYRFPQKSAPGSTVLPDSDPRHKEYCQLQKDCFGFYARNAAAAMDTLADDLLSEGWTHLSNIFGNIEITANHRRFVGQQSIARSMATDAKIR